MPQRGQRRELLGARSAAAGGHLRALVPGEQGAASAEVRDLVQRRQQLVECRGDRATYAREAMARSAPSAAAATASRRIGMPFRCAIPASRSRSAGSDEASRLTFAPPAAAATRQPPAWPQPCGTATVPRLTSSVTASVELDRPVRGADPAALAVGEPERLGVVGVDRGLRACGRRASRAARCASRSCGSAARAGRSGAAGTRGRRRFARAMQLARPRASPAGRGGPARCGGGSASRMTPGARCSASTIPCGLSAQLREAEAAAAQPEQVALGPGAQQQIDEPARRSRTPSLPSRRAAQTLDGTTPIRCESSLDHLPLLPRLAARLDHRLRHLDERGVEQGEERQREVLALVHRRRREHEVAVARGVA